MSALGNLTRRTFFFTLITAWWAVSPALAKAADTTSIARQILHRFVETGMKGCEAYTMLKELTLRAPHRLAGSPGADTAVSVTRGMMERLRLDRIRLEPVMVPHWVRGPVERAEVEATGKRKAVTLAVCALGGSISTPERGVTGEVVEVRSFEELRALGDAAKGKIVFFNRPMDPARVNTFEAYGGAVDQRGGGAGEAGAAGGIAAIVRSMTLALDDVPHTGAMGYKEGVPRIPAAAISTVGANFLSAMIKKEKDVRLRLVLSCKTLPDAPSANVLGEIRGVERPGEIVVVGGHLDSWDKGSGAHDDGSGCVQAIEVLNLFRKLNLKPKRTIRAVMFMNEENGLRGGRAYAVDTGRDAEKHYAAIESDRGGFAPRGFTVQADSLVFEKIRSWSLLFEELNAGRMSRGSGGVDISPIVGKGVPGFGLDVENQRYFDYHHSGNDLLQTVNPRELELGAIAEALLCYLISELGLE